MRLPMSASSSVLYPKLRVSLKAIYETLLEKEHSNSMTSRIQLEILQRKSFMFVDRLSFKWKLMLNPTQ